jgi:hypothetical protein
MRQQSPAAGHRGVERNFAPAKRARGRRRTAAALAVALAALLATPIDTAAAVACKPKKPRPTIVLKNMGPCAFDPETLSFAGEPAEQARCLMRGMDRTRNLGPMPDSLPGIFASHVGQTSGLPEREALGALLVSQGLTWDFAAFLWRPVARARDNDPTAPSARYFVIHDTSGPNYGRRSFPATLDEHPNINNLNNFRCSDNWEKAHVIVNRRGEMLLGHDFEIPWRETKFERALNFAGALKGLFLHVELIQPRRSAPGRGRRNDALAPTPGFTKAQYDRLALLYTIASVRAGRWMVPAFHASIDSGIRGGHDDPQNFERDDFATSLARLLDRLRSEETPAVSAIPKEQDD